MPAKTPPETRLTDRKRAAILKAAAGEFISHGFDLTSMDRIAETANVSKRTVYNHFSSKDDLFQAIVRELMQRADVIPDFPFDPKRSVARQLTAIAMEIVKAVSDKEFQSLSKVVVSRLITAPGFSAMIAEQTRIIEAKLAAWLKDAHKSDCLHVKDPGRAAEQLKGLLLSYSFWPRLIGIREPVDEKEQNEFVKECVKMFLSYYAPSQ